MSPHKEALAQAASARLVAAACGGHGQLWNQQEHLHAAASTQAQAWAAAEPLVAICASCSVVTECRSWAALDEYTGIAARSAWVKGVQKPAHWIHRHPLKKLAS